MDQEAPARSTHKLILYAFQPANRCEVYADLKEYGDRFAEEYRIDSETGQCMTDGWVFLGGMYYIADELRAEALCRRLWGSGIAEVYHDETDDVYYTEWGSRHRDRRIFIFKSQVLLQKNLMLHI